MKFKVQVEWTMTATVEVEADCVDDAILEAGDASTPLPTNGEYLSGSFQVNEEASLVMNEGEPDPLRVYYPTYGIPVGLDEGMATWLLEQQGDGPLALEDVTDVCATYKVSAVLKDEAGFVKGHVDAKGDYRLG